MTRFFISGDQIREKTVFLEGSDHHHLLKVLRKKIGDEIVVLNGKGQEYTAKITTINDTLVEAEILAEVAKTTEPRVKLNLIQSLPKGDKFEFIIQKNTELGISRFQPVISERSTIRLNEEARIKKWERWRKIIKEAAEQSGRKIVPELEIVQDWQLVIHNFRSGMVLIPWEGEQNQSLKDVLDKEKVFPSEVTLLIGPEGGFSLDEVNEACAEGAIPVTLGPRILRTETAALVAASAIFYHYGDLG